MVSRLTKFYRSASPTLLTALWGYIAMGSTMILGLFSVPIALRFLTKEEFGLWNVLGQSLGYLLLLDFGVSWSASRMLVGPLKAGNGQELDSWWTVIVSTLLIQALSIIVIGWLCMDLVPDFFKLSPELRSSAELLWVGMIIVNAAQLPFRAYTGILYCQNRWYLIHLATIISSWLNLIIFAILLVAGWRTTAYLVASAISISANSLIWWLSVKTSGLKLHFRPRLFDRAKLKHLFGYSTGLFLVGIASQLTFMSQAIIIGKVLGIGAVASFVVGTRSAMVILQLIRRPFDSFNPRWLGMYVEGNREEVCHQWRGVMKWFIPAGLVGALGILIYNRSFSLLYGGLGHHEGHWFDLFLACGVLVQTFLHSMNFIFPLSSRIRGWAIAGLIDSILQILLGILLTRWIGGAGLLLGAVLGPLLISIPFMIARGPAEFGVTRSVMFAGIGKIFALGGLAVAICFGLLATPWFSHREWWPTPLEIALGCVVFGGTLIWARGFKQALGKPKEISA